MIDASKLHGFSIQEAECYGKPHLGARYTDKAGTSLTQYARDGRLCVICGRDSLNTHHQPHRGTFTLRGDDGRDWVLRPALFALCGSGTFGCHGAIEHNRIKARWVWDNPEAEAAWWSGELLEKYGPHNPALYLFGCWQFVLEDGTVYTRRPKVKRAGK